MSLDINILKVLVSNKNLAMEFVHECDETLLSPDYWFIGKAIVNYIKTYKEVPTQKVLSEKFSNKKEILDSVNKLFSEIEKTSYDDKEFRFDIDKLKQRFIQNKISRLRSELSDSLNIDKSYSLIKKTIEDVSSITKTKSYERKTLKDSISSFTDEYNAKLDARKNGKELNDSIKTCYSGIDEATGGMREAELILIAGESGSGKSTMLLNIAIQAWLQGNTIDSTEFTEGTNGCYYTLEMPHKVVFNRVLAKLADVNVKRIKSAKLTQDEKARVKKAMEFIKRYPYSFEIIDFPRNTTVEAIEAVHMDIKSSFNPAFIAIDYLQLMDDHSAKNLDDWLKLGVIAERLHEFARVHKIPVLSAVQLNRPKQTKELESNIGLHRIGRSNEIAKNANIIIQLHSRQNESNYPDLEYYIIKNRDGDLIKGRLIKKLECATLIDDPIDTSDDFTDVDDLTESLEDIQRL